MKSVCIPRELFLKYHEEMRDTDIDRVIPDACRRGDMTHIFTISRLLCDVERFIGPEEVMEQAVLYLVKATDAIIFTFLQVNRRSIVATIQ